MRSARNGLLLVAFTVLAIWGADRLLFPHGDHYLVTAEFRDAGGLTKNSNVKIGGVAAGRIKDIHLTGRDTALVTMSLDKGAYPIGPGATAASRPVNLLGEKYIDMNPGNLGQPLPSGTTIPIARTSRPVELDDVLNILAPDVRSRLRILINEAGVALAGRGSDFNALIDQLPPALDQTAKLVNSFSADNKRLGTLIEESDRVLGAMAGKRGDLQDLVSNASGTLAAAARKRQQLAQTVSTAPATLSQLRTTMSQLVDTSTRLQPAAAQLRTATPALVQTLAQLPSFEEQAKPALSSLRTTAPKVTELGAKTRAPIRRLRTSSRQLDTVIHNLKPIVDSFDQHGTKDLLGLMDGWSRTIQKSDGLGHIFGLRIIFDKTLLSTLVDRYVGPSIAPVKGRKAPAKAPSAPLLKTPPITLPKPLKPVANTITTVVSSVDNALSTIQSTVSSVLGRNKSAVGDGGDTNALLNYLVGP